MTGRRMAVIKKLKSPKGVTFKILGKTEPGDKTGGRQVFPDVAPRLLCRGATKRSGQPSQPSAADEKAH